ncbi:unnamed protein product [Sympodiomycopsis kandeliae]
MDHQSRVQFDDQEVLQLDYCPIVGSVAMTLSEVPDERALAELDEETDSLSTLSSSLSLLFQIASTSLYRLSSSQHLQLHPSIPPHVHSTQPPPTGANGTSTNSSGLIPPNEMVEDIKELVEDFMDRVASMKVGIDQLNVCVKDQDHLNIVQELDQEIQSVNTEYLECLREAETLQQQVESLLDQSCP